MNARTILPILFLVLSALGCSQIKNAMNRSAATGSNTSSANSSSSGRTEEAATGDPKDAIVQTSNKFTSLPFFTARMNGTGDAPLQMTLQYAAPDRYHIIHQGGMADGTEMVIIGKDTYMKAGGKWTRLPGNLGEKIPSLRDQFTEEGMKRLKNVKYEGSDTLNGKPADVYSYDSTTPVEESAFHSKIWVVRSTGLPARITVDYQNGKLKEMTVDYDTDTPVTIEAPIK